jgi:diguanylate cyclase (GGDEF)-like protein
MTLDCIEVLVIEDNDGDFRLVSEYLKESRMLSFEIIRARDLSGALSLIRERKIGAALLDLNLPDSQGLSTLESMVRASEKLPIIVFTGLDDEKTGLDALHKGAQDYLAKGCIQSDLLARSIRYAIERKKMETDLKEANAALQELVAIDKLTGLKNRRGLEDFLTYMMPRLRRFLQDSHALLIDLDDFKEINDAFGYVVGDMALKEASKIIQGTVRSTDYVARVGGDEFIILLPGTRNAEAIKVAEKVRLEISKATVGISGSQKIGISASVGVVDLKERQFSIDELFESARRALRTSKHMGKNLVSYGDKNKAFRFEDNAVGGALDQLCAGNRMEIVMQPIVNIKDGTPVAYELLSRFNHSEFGLPDDFFRIAKEAKVLTLVDHACLKRCLSSLEILPLKMRAHINLFPSTIMNLSIKQLLDEFDAVKNQRSFCVEISEQQFIGDPAYLIEAIRFLKSRGIAVAIDDAGFGGSCMESIILLEPDIVKIDKRCVQGIDKDKSKAHSLKRILKIVHSCNAVPIVEGIETIEELEALSDFDVEYGQGYYFGKPSAELIIASAENK